jgi:hypothetical protein
MEVVIKMRCLSLLIFCSFVFCMAQAQTLGSSLDGRINAGHFNSRWILFSGEKNGQRLAFDISNSRVDVYSEVQIGSNSANAVKSITLPGSPISVQGLNLDYNADGRPDVLAIEAEATSIRCDDGTMAFRRTAKIYSGINPASQLFASSPILDRCIPINSGPTTQYVGLSTSAIQFGANTGQLAIVPQYFPYGYFYSNAKTDFFYTPETENYAYYVNKQSMLQPSARTSPGQPALSYQALTQPLNGIILNIAGQVRYISTSSGRFMQYGLGPYSVSQLVSDTPFLARLDLVGRTYGPLQYDYLSSSQNLYLINGPSAYSVYLDYLTVRKGNGLVGNDLWGGIERHISLFNTQSFVVTQRFLSYAHDPSNLNANTYRGRPATVANYLLPSQSPLGSRAIYNLFNGNTWAVQITTPGGVESQMSLSGYFVWDVIPVDKDTVDVVVSPVDSTNLVYVPDYVSSTGVPQSWRFASYLPQRKTQIFRWSRSLEQLSLLRSFENGIPYMLHFGNSGFSASSSSIYTTVRGLDKVTGKKPVLILTDANGTLKEAELPPLPSNVVTPPQVDPPTESGQWKSQTVLALRCQYASEGPSGAPKSGSCAILNATNVYEINSGIQGNCAATTFIRNRVTQVCAAK